MGLTCLLQCDQSFASQPWGCVDATKLCQAAHDRTRGPGVKTCYLRERSFPRHARGTLKHLRLQSSGVRRTIGVVAVAGVCAFSTKHACGGEQPVIRRCYTWYSDPCFTPLVPTRRRPARKMARSGCRSQGAVVSYLDWCLKSGQPVQVMALVTLCTTERYDRGRFGAGLANRSMHERRITAATEFLP